MLADQVDYVVGVDTHRDEHVLAVVVASTGAVVAQRSVAATARGYGQALSFADEHAGGRRVWAIEGAGHDGAGLARHLSGHGETALEAGRGPRNERRLHGKDDRLTRSAPPGRRSPASLWRCRAKGNDGRLCGYCWSLAAAPLMSVGKRSCSYAA